MGNKSKERLYRIWIGMRSRCKNVSDSAYKHYGARGIRVCDEWGKSYDAFREWAYANGYDENASYGKCTLDRIDVNGNYEPSNCRWANMQEQSFNRTNSKPIEFNGKSLTVGQWALEIGVDPHLLIRRLDLGWSVEKTLTTPAHGADAEARQRQRKRVVCVETGKIFDSIKSAANWADVGASTIQHALLKPTFIAGGFHWIRYGGKIDENLEHIRASILADTQARREEITQRRETANSNKGIRARESYAYLRKKVLCVEINKTFDSVVEAARWAEVNRTNISAACKGKVKTVRGYHWKYAE